MLSRLRDFAGAMKGIPAFRAPPYGSHKLFVKLHKGCNAHSVRCICSMELQLCHSEQNAYALQTGGIGRKFG
jgi:hypothetical protein